MEKRVQAINKLAEAGYKIGILIAPVILVKNWKIQYEELLKFLENNLSEKAKKKIFFEIIFMTYSYVHRMINSEAFPTLVNLYNQDIMTGRGKGKYIVTDQMLEKRQKRIYWDLIKRYFPNNEIKYVS
ncbi:MAG: spore photoproduct lyase family protein [Clostridia bacterium]